MRVLIKSLFLLPGLVFGFGLIPTVPLAAQRLTVLHTFNGDDGATPYGDLILSGNTLYGTAYTGGRWGNGTVFKVNTNGTGFINLHSFPYTFPIQGFHPYAGLILSGDILYGTTVQGGGSDDGTVFAVNTDGTGFTNVYSFTGGLRFPNYQTNRS